MPVYEYECTGCGERFELRRNMADKDDEIRCPKCRADGPRRLFSAFGMVSSGYDTVSSSEACATGRFT